MSYYINYAGVDLSDIVVIRDISGVSSLPPRENSETELGFGNQGNVYNSFKYGNREMEITFLVIDETNKDAEFIDETIQDIKRIFHQDEPRPLFLGDESKFIYAIMDGDMELTELSSYCVECKVKMIAYDPVFYSNESISIDNDEGVKNFTIENTGTTYTYPMFVVGFSKQSKFVQIENSSVGKKLLLGNLPTLETNDNPTTDIILDDNCESTTGWTTGSISVDGGRATGGTIGITDSGNGIKVADFGSKGDSDTWFGASFRKNLNTQVQDFLLETYMHCNSTGINGDPTVGDNETSNDTILSGSKVTFYRVSHGTNVRSSATTKSKVVGYLTKGTDVTPISVSKGWAKFTYKGTTRYASTKYMKKMTRDGTVTVKCRNYVTTEKANLRDKANKKTGKILCTIPAGTTIRCRIDKQYGTSPTYYKLAAKYKGHIGYVAVSTVTQASNVTYDYEEELITADDKMGCIEIYGYSENNSKLFKFGFYDDNPYYEFNYPVFQVNNQIILTDKDKAPDPKEKTEISESDDKLTIKVKKMLSGKYGSWNEFYGKLKIQRKGNKWTASITKIKDGDVIKTLSSNETTINGSSNEKLAYIVCYIGTNESAEKATACSLTDVKIKSFDKPEESDDIIETFEAGDVLKIDCHNQEITLNDNVYSNIDIGSELFELQEGDNNIQIKTDDDSMSTSVIYNERWL